jgi:hypothetical protein
VPDDDDIGAFGSRLREDALGTADHGVAPANVGNDAHVHNVPCSRHRAQVQEARSLPCPAVFAGQHLRHRHPERADGVPDAARGSTALRRQLPHLRRVATGPVARSLDAVLLAPVRRGVAEVDVVAAALDGSWTV